MSKIKKYTDWGTWFDGLRTNVMKAGATSIVTNLSVLASTNMVATLPLKQLAGVGENWKTFVVGLFAQFVLHVVYAAALYTQANQPQVVTEVLEEASVTQGNVTIASSTKTTTTPIQTAEIFGQKSTDGDKVGTVEPPKT